MAASPPPVRPAGKKRKAAVLLGYVGAGYSGFQRNPGVVTVEDELLRALVAAGAVAVENTDDPGRKLSWSRAARTDKGVSAVGQVVAAKFRVFGVVRTTSGFNAKTLCDRRRYHYLLPAWTLDPNQHAPPELGEPGAEATAEQLEALNAVLSQFVGTHSFHNFSPGAKAGQPEAKRYILSFSARSAGAPCGLPCVLLDVLGQSFVLNQIRKMVGTALGIVRGVLPRNHVQVALTSPERVPTPLAPETGLFLAECIFHAYNTRWGESHETVALSSCSPGPAEFESNIIVRHIVETELKDGGMAKWLRELRERAERAEGGGAEPEAGADADAGASSSDGEEGDSDGEGTGATGKRARQGEENGRGAQRAPVVPPKTEPQPPGQPPAKRSSVQWARRPAGGKDKSAGEAQQEQ